MGQIVAYSGQWSNDLLNIMQEKQNSLLTRYIYVGNNKIHSINLCFILQSKNTIKQYKTKSNFQHN